MDADQDPNVYPAPHHPLPLLNYTGGHLITSPKLVTITFVGDTLRDDLRQFDDTLVASDWWQAIAHPYGIDRGRGGIYAEAKDTVSGKTLDNVADVKTWIQDQVTAGTVPAPDADTIYAIYYPASTTILLGTQTSCTDFSGFHDAAEVRIANQVMQVPYAVLPRCADEANLTLSASHELIEAATDPQPDLGQGWYMRSADAWSALGGGEVADLCESRGKATLGSWTVATGWSNDAAKASHDPCQPAAATATYFAAAPETETATVHASTGDHPSDGFVIVARGASRTVTVMTFSERALPSDVQLVVGRPASSTDPSKMGPIAKGVTATLSRTTTHNGLSSTLTVTASTAAAPADTLFIVRALAPSGEYHSWPAILRVM